MTDDDYLARRAGQEVWRAPHATPPAAVRARYRQSTAYLERLHPAPTGKVRDRG